MSECKDGVCSIGPLDNLEGMLKLQEKLQSRLGTLNFTKGLGGSYKSELDRTNFIKAHAQYCEAELHEMLRELRFFKSWKQYNWTAEEEKERFDNAQEEFIDALHFMLNIAIALDLDSDSIFKLYCKKNQINHERQDNNY